MSTTIEIDEEDREVLDRFVDDDDTIEAVLADVQAALERLVELGFDLEEPADLDRVRQALPTEPARAQLVHAALPDPIRESLEYVRPSERQSGYWRRPKNRTDYSKMSDAEVKSLFNFLETAEEMRGVKGTIELADGRRVPRSALAMRDELEGVSYTDDELDVDEEKGQGILRSIMDRL